MTFGTISSLTDAGSDWLENQLTLKELTEKVIDSETLSTDTTPVIYDNSFFQFSKEEKNRIRKQVENIKNGNNLADLGCGEVERAVDFNDFESSFDNLRNVKPAFVKDTLTSSIDNIIEKSAWARS